MKTWSVECGIVIHLFSSEPEAVEGAASPRHNNASEGFRGAFTDWSRMRTTIHYVVIKPDSRPDGTAIRDHARVRVYFLQRKKMRQL